MFWAKPLIFAYRETENGGWLGSVYDCSRGSTNGACLYAWWSRERLGGPYLSRIVWFLWVKRSYCSRPNHLVKYCKNLQLFRYSDSYGVGMDVWCSHHPRTIALYLAIKCPYARQCWLPCSYTSRLLAHQTKSNPMSFNPSLANPPPALRGAFSLNDLND